VLTGLGDHLGGGCLGDPIVLPLSMALSRALHILDYECYLFMCYLLTEKGHKLFPPIPHTGSCFAVNLADFTFG